MINFRRSWIVGLRRTLKNNIQPINVYLDFATLPSLNFLLHFLEHLEEPTVDVFGLGRFNFTQNIIDSLPHKRIYFTKIDFNKYHSAIKLVEQALQEYSTVELNIHLNGAHAIQMLQHLFKGYRPYLDKIKDIQLYLYDEGTEGLKNRYQIKKDIVNLTQNIQKDKFELTKLFFLENPELSLASRYLLDKIYPCHYFFISDEIIQDVSLEPLKREIKNYSLMDFDRLGSLNHKQKEILFKILRLEQSYIDRLIEVIKQRKIFLFTGTTVYGRSIEEDKWLINHISHSLLNFAKPAGKYYLGEDYCILFKGHPNAAIVNQKLREVFPDGVFLPEHIPFEILYLLGIKPHKVGGFISSTYLILDKNSIADVIFMANEKENSPHFKFHRNYHQDLMDIFLEMNVLQKEKCHYLNSIKYFTHKDL